MSPARLFAVLLLLLPTLVLTPLSKAQLPPSASTTSTPIPGAGHDYLGGQADTVNPANGSISLRIPVIMPPSRGITLPFSFAYDSNGVNYLTPPTGLGTRGFWATTNSTISEGGWSNTAPVVGDSELTWQTLGEDGHTQVSCHSMINFVFQDPSGNRHNLNLSNYSDPSLSGVCTINTQNWPPSFSGQMVYQGGEGSVAASMQTGWTPNPFVSVTDGDGTGFGFPVHAGFFGQSANTWLATSAVDRNGNTININSSYPAPNYTAVFSYTDTAGRTVLQDSGFAVSPETVTVSGLGSNYTLTWTTLSTPSFSTAITTLSGSCSTAHNTWGAGNNQVVSSIKLPNGQSYSFSYDTIYGLVNKVTYPTGGYVRYVWGTNTNSEMAGSTNCVMEYAVPAISDRYVSFDGVNEVEHQHFSYSTTWNYPSSAFWVSKQTAVTTYDLVRNANFQTVYAYAGVGTKQPPNSGTPTAQDPAESSVAYYNTNGSLLKTVGKKWENIRLLASEQTAFPNGQSSLTSFCYDSNEEPIEKDEYDFGTANPALPACNQWGAPAGAVYGSLLRKTATTYATSTNMGTYHVVDKPAKVQVYDSSGSNLVAETDYGYDTPSGTVTSNIVQHSGSCNCGNLTSESHWLNTSGSYLTTTYTNDDTGQRLSMTDPRGNQTTYSYSDNYSSGTPPGTTNAYLTQVTHPQTNGINHIEKFAYAYASGEVTSSTDQNNLVTSYKYSDSLARLTETDLPDGGSTIVAYNDSPYNASTPSPSVTTTKKINSSTSLVAVAAMDGLGHARRTEVTSDPQGIVYSDTAYDGLGRVYTVSNPYRSGTDPTTSAGTTTYGYDTLSRKTSVTYPDSSLLATAYCGSSTLVTDPVGKWRRSRTDGVGRLVEVDEPNAVGAAVNSNGCPGQSDPIWVTSYGYDALGNLTSVLQNGSHARSFTHDSLSRLLCSSNPENSFAACPPAATSVYTPGTVGYTYDTDSNVASKIVSTSHSSGTSGSGSATVNGAEQSIAGAPAVSGTGSVTFSGTLQSKQVLTQAATHATGSVSIVGSEQSGNFCDDTGKHCHFLYDSGSVTITVNGVGYSVSYGQTDTSNTVAANLASTLNSSGVVTATASGSTVNLTSVATGTSANYSLSASSFTNNPTDFSVSFVPFPSGSTLTGGANAVYTTRYDSGTSTITVNGHSDTVGWSGSGTTTSSIASSLASTINADSGAYVSASASGATVNLTAKAAGASTDYSLSSSYTYDSADFSSSSFTSSNSGAALTGGRDAGATVYDSGSVWITINGTQYSTSYGQSSTTSSLASTLASAINAGSLANASANASGVSITAKTVGAATNYSMSSGSSTSQPGSFSSPSFSVSVSGGSLTGGTDPGLPIVTSYSYDALNRESVRTYSNGDPTITTTYDQSACLGLPACQNIGHATSITDGAGSESWAYQTDPANLRSVHVNQRTTNNITKPSKYYFDLAANLTSITYPTGRSVNYTYDAANRPATAADSANGITYAAAQSSPPSGCLTAGVCYTPQGTDYSSAIGKTSGFAGVNFSETYNNRLQPLEIKASSAAGTAIDITYSFADPVTLKNADHVYSITNNLNSSRTQKFTYDQVNRIVSAGTSATSGTYCWGYLYNYDAWGNLLAQAGWSPNYIGCSEAIMGSVTADGNNHISAFTYDTQGNTQNDGTIAYTYDAESQIKTAAGVTYSYDGSGRRVSKSNGKLYWYGSGGEILAETDGSGNTLSEYIFFGGKRIAILPSSGNAQYYIEDLLGSSRAMTQNNGTPCYDADFDPYGGEHAYTNTCSQNYKFEGKERDTETGNDDFGARYYTSRFGRWLSADWSNVPVPVPYANLTNPQTLNLYAMVSDDPETSADLDGHAAGQGVQYSTPTCAASGQTGSSSDSGCGSQAPNLAQDMAQATEQSRRALDSAITTISQGLPGGSVMAGIEKAAWNFVAGAANLLSSGFDFKTVQAPILQGSNTDEKVTMGTVAAASVVVPIAVHALPSEVPESIPAGPSPRPTAAQQRAIDEMGEAHGCHTCGTPNPGTKTGKWVGDHQPSTKLNKGGGPQVYKPQCLACSRRQGGEVTAALRSASKTIVPQ